jgi:hypothetical protein
MTVDEMLVELLKIKNEGDNGHFKIMALDGFQIMSVGKLTPEADTDTVWVEVELF